MKVSELIAKLSAHVAAHGDGDVGAEILDAYEYSSWHDVKDVKACNDGDVELEFW